jgi:hypothetical protein
MAAEKTVSTMSGTKTDESLVISFSKVKDVE